MNKNSRLFSTRYQQIVCVALLLMFVLGIKLFMVTIVQHDKWTAEASDQNTKIVYTSAPRGDIYDCNGILLATSKQVFTANFNASALETEQINESSLALINTLKKNKDKYTDNFPIKITSKGNFYYTYKRKITNWLKDEGFSTDLTAEQAFSALIQKYNINESLDRYEAMSILREKYNLDPPISVKKMVYTPDIELELFLGRFAFTEAQIAEGVSAEECFKKLREKYKIDTKLSDREARKIFVVRNEIAVNGFTKYLPIKIASDISQKSIAYLEECNLPGIEIQSESERYYPNGDVACHILGYMGAISESEKEHYVDDLGYSSTDLIGKAGIEAAYESKLHGTPGMRKIRVNSSGQYVETISETEAKKGSDVYLTIDINLQKKTEEALEKAIRKNPHSQSGATVAIDVETADVLALASYPTYDPNIFAKGISTKAWKSVQAENPRNVFSPAPLYNNATRAAIQPGSVFKPITALTAVEKGLSPGLVLPDKGVINLGGHPFGCYNWNEFRRTHGSQNLEMGIGNSCNYYFYCIGTGKNWASGGSLGYKITVSDILKTAKNFGLGDKTGIEIGESSSTLPSAERKLASTELGVRDYLYSNAHTYFPEKVANNITRLRKNLNTIAGWTKENPSYSELVTRLKEKTDVKSKYIDKVASDVKYNYYIQAEWGVGDQFNISIGQGDNAYTPIQIANYLATLGNGGVRNQVSVVAAVEGEGRTVKPAAKNLGYSKGNIEAVIRGMRRVCTHGTLRPVYGNFSVDVAGKTGTAQNQSVKQPKDEVAYIKRHLGYLNSASGSSVRWSQVTKIMNQLMEKDPDRYPTKNEAVDEAVRKASNYKITKAMINRNKGSYDSFAWTMAMAPASDPKIGVVSMLVEGGMSENAAPVTKDVLTAYFKIGKKQNSSSKKYTTLGDNVQR